MPGADAKGPGASGGTTIATLQLYAIWALVSVGIAASCLAWWVM